MIEAIFFDNDGVLVDTEHFYFAATREMLAEVEIELSVERYSELSLRLGRSCFDLAREAGVDEPRLEALRLERNARYHARLAAGVPLMEGVSQALTSLHGTRPMALVTTTTHEHFDTIHRPHDTHRFFEFVVAHGDYARSKPHPDPYLSAAARLGVAPEACVVIEDSERGMRAAHAAGMRCLVVPNALTASGDFSAAHRRLEHIREVPEAVSELIAGRG